MLTNRGVIAVDRRELIVSIAGLAAGSACTARSPEGDAALRPSLVVEAEGPGRWRIRSWQWRGDAWRPAIARAVAGAGGIAVSGKIDAASRAEVLGRLAI